MPDLIWHPNVCGLGRGRSMALEIESGCAVALRRERCTGTVAVRIMLALDWQTMGLGMTNSV